MTKNHVIVSIFILLLGFILRISGIHWDNGYHFHPDERMLIMVADRVHLFSQLNPDFFNYGSLPIYLLKGTSQIIDYTFNTVTGTYDGLLFVGRWLSTIADMLVLIVVYNIAIIIFKNKRKALWSSFFYAISFFPIQNSHFFVVDVYLNFFATLLLYLLLRYHEVPSMKKIVMIGIVYAAALTTKVSAVIFFPVIMLVILVSHTRRLHWWKQLLARITAVIHHSHDTDTRTYLITVLTRCIIFCGVTAVCAFIFMPYAFLEFDRFASDILMQTKMNSDAYIFPYTLQYVGTAPYLYYLKNIFFWGVGPAMGILAILGIADMKIIFLHELKEKVESVPSSIKKLIHVLHNILDNNLAIVTLFYLIYFVVIGHSAVKFMRYMLLLYPLIALLAGAGADLLQKASLQTGSRRIALPIVPIIVAIAILWTLAFTSIYTRENTRIRATQWINQFIPAGSILAVEHWDDRVPIFDPGKYQYVEMTLYDQPDDTHKWNMLEEKLNTAEYIILASNRLYVPLQRLNDCNRYKSCYPLTAKYYEELFAEKRGFTKVIEFSSYPQLSFAGLNLTINDDTADESFTVYDHPKIIIFKKNIE